MVGQRRRRAAVGAAIVALVVLAAAVVLARVGADDGGGDAGGQAPAGDVEPTGGPGLGGVSPGGARSEQGAVAAAVAYASLGQRWLYLTDDEVRRAVAQVAAPGSADGLAEEVVADTRAAREELAAAEGRVWWLVRPLAWRVDDYTDDVAVVEVWTVSVLSSAGVAAPQSEWTTLTLDLQWTDDGWRVDAASEEPGPTPMTSPADEPWDARPFDDTLEGFTRIGADDPRGSP